MHRSGEIPDGFYRALRRGPPAYRKCSEFFPERKSGSSVLSGEKNHPEIMEPRIRPADFQSGNPGEQLRENPDPAQRSPFGSLLQKRKSRPALRSDTRDRSVSGSRVRPRKKIPLMPSGTQPQGYRWAIQEQNLFWQEPVPVGR